MQLRTIAISLSTLLACSVAAWGQFDTGSITGTVFDPTGRAVPGAKIKLFKSDIGLLIEAATNESGIYEFPAVRVGAYRLTAEKTGFSTATIDQVGVSVGARTRQDIRLTVGEVSQTVEASGESSLVESETSQRGQVIPGDTIRELPLNGREYSSLLLASAGTKFSPIGTGSAVTVLTREHTSELQ